MWVKYFELDQAKLKDMYYKGQSWGELASFQWIADSQYMFGVGWYDNVTMSRPRWSPPIPVTYSVYDKRCMIDIDALAMVSSGATGTVYVAIDAFKDGSSVAPYIYCIGLGIKTAPNRNTGIPFKISLHVEPKKITVYMNNEKMGEIQLSDEANAIRLGVLVENPSYYIGCMFTYISASYFDIVAGIVQQITAILQTIMYLLIGVMFISLIVRAFRPKRKEEKEKEREKR